jgi:DNA invertase Pin-like site-specific DNA recombinase
MGTIAIYARASIDREDKRVSVERQVARCNALVEERFGDTEVRTFVDNDLSGAKPGVVRPGYDDLLDAVRRGDVTELVCHEQSRLTRQPAQWEDLIVTLTKAGIERVYTVQSGTIEIGGSKLISRIMAAVDAEEAERIRARVTAASAQNAAEGRPHGPPSYGYGRAIGGDGRPQWVINPEEARIVRRMCDRICSGRSVNSIAAELDDEEVPVPRGKRWYPTTVRRIVTASTIAGIRSHHGVEAAPAIWEPIITEDRFRQVARALDSKVVTGRDGVKYSTERRSHSSARRWLLSSGLLRCGLCGVAMVTHRTNQGTLYYCATTRRQRGCGRLSVGPAAKVDEWVYEQLLGQLSTPEMAERLTAHLSEDKARLLAERARAGDLMNEAASLRGSGVYSLEQWERQFYPAKAAFDAASDALGALTDDPALDVPSVGVVRERWAEIPVRQRQRVLAIYIDEIVVSPGQYGPRPRDPYERIAKRTKISWRV